eukprot:TRINITY_DN201_c1_g1_i4.p2 TRINITY_DN201_c1_g1~~TRINITY_DN201_c1_g1_i4.p2  ORF type:complete len:104 (+),score=42.31 TRINITY_DN201_c1_g1_i4:289-600(+)
MKKKVKDRKTKEKERKEKEKREKRKEKREKRKEKREKRNDQETRFTNSQNWTDNLQICHNNTNRTIKKERAQSARRERSKERKEVHFALDLLENLSFLPFNCF